MDERDLEDQRNENENEERQENREDVEMAAAEQLLAGANPAPAMQPMQQDDRENPGGDDSDDPAPGLSGELLRTRHPSSRIRAVTLSRMEAPGRGLRWFRAAMRGKTKAPERAGSRGRTTIWM